MNSNQISYTTTVEHASSSEFLIFQIDETSVMTFENKSTLLLEKSLSLY